MRRAIVLAGVGVFLTGAFLAGYERTVRSSPSASTQELQAVRAELASRYYRSVPARVLQLRTVSSIIAALHDPYTEYLDRRAYDLLRRQLSRHYAGIGVTVLPSSDGLVVVTVLPGPAQYAGIRQGDLIVRVGRRSTLGLGSVSAASLLAGPSGKPLRLEVRRQGRLLHVTLRRAIVISPNVSERTIRADGRTYGYVAVLWFGDGTAARVAADLRRFRAAHVAGIVLDLRNDPGGLLTEGVRTASLFLHGGRVVTLVGVHQPRRTFRADTADLVPRLPLAVLIDGSSASAAEVVAAALADNGRATLVGTHTFGKAVVQTLEPLANGGALALTTARYLTPAGADISRRGVVPSLVVRADPRTKADEVLDAGLRALAASR
jgi:carboxyl-terminal processing protease